jgi:hypothetical protein
MTDTVMNDITIKPTEPDEPIIPIEPDEPDEPTNIITLEDLQLIINTKCTDLGIEEITLYSTDCSICFGQVETDNWQILHPCGHVFCKSCIERVHHLPGTIRVSCPNCRKPGKYIGFDGTVITDNMRLHSSLPNSVNQSVRQSVRQSVPLFNQMQQNVPSRSYTSAPPISAGRMSTIAAYDDNYSVSDPDALPSIAIRRPTNILSSDSTTTNSDLLLPIYSVVRNLEDPNQMIGSFVLNTSGQISSGSIGNDFVLVIDDSGSMGSVRNEIKEYIKSFINKLTERDRITLVYFGSSARQLFALQPVTTIFKQQACTLIDDFYDGSGTNYYNAFILVNKIIEEISDNTRPIITIFGSDGQPDSACPDQIDNLYRIIAERNISFKIYTVSFGGDISSDVLQGILRGDNITNYHHTNTPDDFDALMNEIGCVDNVVIAKQITITFTGCKPLLSIAEQYPSNPNKYFVKISIIRSGDFITFPFEVISAENSTESGSGNVSQTRTTSESEPSVTLSYLNSDGVLIDTLCNRSSSFDPNTIQHQWKFKKRVAEIMYLANNRILSSDQKRIEVNRIRESLTTELYGIFTDEITSIVNTLLNSLSNHNQDHSATNAFRQASSQASGHSASRQYSAGLQSSS